MSGKAELRNIGIALGAIWIAIVAYSFLYHLSGLLTIHGFVFQPWVQIRAITFYQWTPWVLLAPLVWYLARAFPIRPGIGVGVLGKHFVLMTVLATIHAYVAAQVYYHIGDLDPGMEAYAPWQHTGHFLFLNDMYLMDCFVYSALIASVTVRSYFELARQKELDAERSQTQLAESKLQALRMQVNPHFLFNALNSAVALIRKDDNRGAQIMLNRLSDFFRLTLEHGREQLVPLREELLLVEQYLEIEKIRFSDRMEVVYAIDSACLDERIPVLLLQPLVENAVKHGVGRSRGRCCLRIHVEGDADGLRIDVSNDSAAAETPASQSTGVGLNNVRSRLHALYGSRARFSFENTPGRGASATILLPQALGDAAPV